MGRKAIILTLPLENNYGGLLQAYALQKVISKMGFDVVTDRKACKNKNWKDYLLWLYLPIRYKQLELKGEKPLTPQRRESRCRKLNIFINENIKTVDFFKGRDKPRRKEIEKYDVYVVGSDQVWRKKYVRVKSYFLDFLKEDDKKCRIAYAASYGTDNLDEWNDDDIETCRNLIQKFKVVSVREKEGKDITERYFNTQAEQVLDPTLLMTREDYLKLDGIENIPQRNKMLFCYVIDMTEDKKRLMNKLKEEKGLEQILFISPKLEQIDKSLSDDYVYPSVSEWLAGFRDADFVFTDSFHGTVFSILFNKQFVCYANKSRGLSRFESLLGVLNLRENLIFSSEDYMRIERKVIDFCNVNETLKDLRVKSLAFLSKGLDV